MQLNTDPNHVRLVDVKELKRLRDEQADIQVIDVREADELAICNIGAYHIPLGEIDKRYQEIPQDKPVIIHCKSGRRSEMAVRFLQQMHGFQNLYNLDGGILAYANEVDSSLTTY